MEKAKKLIFESKLKLIFIDDFAKAGEAITKFATIMSLARSLNLDVNFVLRSNGTKDKAIKC